MNTAIFDKSRNAAVLEIDKIIERLAVTDLPILITGATGTGKEVIAEIIHQKSKRNAGALSKINCAAYPETLFDSELFGYEKGAFTGADHRKAGILEYAHGGTLLLDEIGDMPALIQAKILRVSDGKSFTRLGGREELKTNVRLISATHKNLQDDIDRKIFREDLYHRLVGATIRLPSLRERAEDIEAIAMLMLQNIERDTDTHTAGFDNSCMLAMISHPWPGNFRELRQRILKAVALTPMREKITTAALFDAEKENIENLVAGTLELSDILKKLSDLNLDNITYKITIEALERSAWEQKSAAALLGMSPRALHHYITQNEIVHPSWKTNTPEKLSKRKEQ